MRKASTPRQGEGHTPNKTHTWNNFSGGFRIIPQNVLMDLHACVFFAQEQGMDGWIEMDDGLWDFFFMRTI
jgi:hypothetical protein